MGVVFSLLMPHPDRDQWKQCFFISLKGWRSITLFLINLCTSGSSHIMAMKKHLLLHHYSLDKCHSAFPFLPGLIQSSSFTHSKLPPYSFTFHVCICVIVLTQVDKLVIFLLLYYTHYPLFLIRNLLKIPSDQRAIIVLIHAPLFGCVSLSETL